MGRVARDRAGWIASGVSASLVGFWLVLGGASRIPQDGFRAFLETDYANIVFGLMFPVVGALALSRLPGHRLGWLYCLSGLACAVALVSYSYAQQGLVDAPGSLPGALAAGWVSSWVWMCGFAFLMTLGVLGFPDGHLPSVRWWPVVAISVVTITAGVIAIALRPGPLENHPTHDNPLGVPFLAGAADVVERLWLWFLTFAILASLASLVVRYRRGTRFERDQLRWLVIAAALLVTSFAIPADGPAGIVGSALVVVALPLLPLSVGVAALRSRLDDVAAGIRRSVVYAWLLAAGLVLYAVVVLTLHTILRGHAEPAVALLGAGVVAVAYQPLRERLQRSTDRMLYGDRGDPYSVSATLGRRLESFGSAAHALPASVGAIAEALRLPYVAIELPGDSPQQPTAAYGSPQATPSLAIPLTHGGESVGRLLVGLRDGRDDYTQDERRLLEDLSRVVAVAAHAALLDRALQRSQDRLALVRAEERSRLRRDLHDGLGPALAGVALGVDAARNLMDTDAQAADRLLEELKKETLGCVADVRRIVNDLRAPPLAELGLCAALTAFAERLSTRGGALRVDVEAARVLPTLPTAVEDAAYLIATEALTNVARHAAARRCLLRLVVADDLTIEVSDDGVGITPNGTPGVGLASMSERAARLGGDCVVRRAADGGTTVLAHLPLVAA